MMSEKENKFKKEIEEIYKSQNLKKEIKPTEEDISKFSSITLVLKSLGYFFLIFYLIIFLKIEPIFSFLNKPSNISDGWIYFTIIFGIVCMYHAVVDMLQRLKKFFKKDNQE